MADSVSSQILLEGSRSMTLKLTNVSDGTGETAVEKANPGNMSGNPSSLVIDAIEFSTMGMGCIIYWDGAPDVPAWILPADMSDCLDFAPWGGLIQPNMTTPTGKILLTTVGHSSGDTYAILLHLQKRGVTF